MKKQMMILTLGLMFLMNLGCNTNTKNDEALSTNQSLNSLKANIDVSGDFKIDRTRGVKSLVAFQDKDLVPQIYKGGDVDELYFVFHIDMDPEVHVCYANDQSCKEYDTTIAVILTNYNSVSHTYDSAKISLSKRFKDPNKESGYVLRFLADKEVSGDLNDCNIRLVKNGKSTFKCTGISDSENNLKSLNVSGEFYF